MGVFVGVVMGVFVVVARIGWVWVFRRGGSVGCG